MNGSRAATTRRPRATPFPPAIIGTHFSLSPDLFANPFALPTQDTSQGGPARTLGVYWTHILSPSKVNELRFSAQQINFTFGPLPSTASSPLEAVPNITISGLDGYDLRRSQSEFPAGPRSQYLRISGRVLVDGWKPQLQDGCRPDSPRSHRHSSFQLHRDGDICRRRGLFRDRPYKMHGARQFRG